MMCEDNTSLFVRPSVHRCVLTSISGDLSCQSVIVFVVCTEFFGLRHKMWFWPSVLSGLFCVSCRRSAAACLSFAEPCHSRYYLRILLNWNLCRAIYVFLWYELSITTTIIRIIIFPYWLPNRRTYKNMQKIHSFIARISKCFISFSFRQWGAIIVYYDLTYKFLSFMWCARNFWKKKNK